MIIGFLKPSFECFKYRTNTATHSIQSGSHFFLSLSPFIILPTFNTFLDFGSPLCLRIASVFHRLGILFVWSLFSVRFIQNLSLDQIAEGYEGVCAHCLHNLHLAYLFFLTCSHVNWFNSSFHLGLFFFCSRFWWRKKKRSPPRLFHKPIYSAHTIPSFILFIGWRRDCLTC